MFENVQGDLHHIFLASVTLIAILNPFGNLPQFIAMTEGVKTPLRKKLFSSIVLVAFCIVVVFLLSGSFIMNFLFGVDLDDVRIAGGLILVIMGLKILLFPQTTTDYSHYHNLHYDELFKQSIIPMAFPMLVGPGTLATVIVIAEDKGMFIAIGAVLCAFVFLYVLFYYAASIEHILGKLVLHVISRIALVFITAMGVKMMISGLSGIGVITSHS